MARHYRQEEKHRYVWYCVQGITNLDVRRRAVAELSAKHRLSDQQIATLEEWLTSLDAKRQERERQRQERASISPIEYAIAHPTRENLLDLRSGRDQFSKHGLPKLRNMAGDQPEIDNSQRSDADKAAAYRWVLRGLPAELAMRKIVYGVELAERRENRRDISLLEEECEREAAWDDLRELDEDEMSLSDDAIEDARPHDYQIKTYLAGAKYHDTSKAAVGPVELEWEPANPHDPNAIKITQSGVHLGYVPKEIASTIRHGSTARLTAVGKPWTVIIEQSFVGLP